MNTKTVRIGNIEFQITEVDGLKRVSDDAYLYGHIQHDTEVIEINAGLAPTTKKVALLHELVHAMLFQGGLMLDDTIEEQVCVRLSFALLDFVKNNRALIQELDDVEA